MEKTELSTIQLKIVEALEHQKDKAYFTESTLAKSVRIIGNIEGKKKAGIAFSDLEKAVLYLESNNLQFFSITTNSVNEFLITNVASQDLSKSLNPDAKKRRLASEKSMVVFSNSDVTDKKDSKKIKALKKQSKIRTKTEKINIYSNFEDLD